jgi:Rad3-related DNA helicase
MGANWVWQFDDRGHVTFEPIRLSGFTSRLFAGVPRVLLMSASLSEFTLKLLLPPDLAYEYRAWPPVFPQDHAPVYHIPTVKLNWKSTDEDYKLVIERADQIIDGRTDRKGIVHTVSYARTKRILQHSRHSRRFIWNEDSSSLGKSLELFRQSSDRILVTPSVEEGFDFAGSACEYQIVLKFPFPNETQRVIKERCAQIPGYRLHYAAQKIVQMRGRPIRSYHDRAEMFVLDNSVKQLSGPEGRSYLPSGFRIFTVNAIPPAPPKIRQSDIREET